ncbi:MAG TPA: hypothetical protein VF600_03420 [Abditibacteriaceae bacterium]|jgi:hypothetical protein
MSTHRVLVAVLSAVLALAAARPGGAVDHNNIDAGRPLDFDDAEAIAYREKALEFGGALVKPHGGKPGVQGAVEFLYGFAPNTHLSFDFDPRYSSEGNEKRRFDTGDVGVGLFHNFNREHGNIPALSLRADAYLPTGRNSRGIDLRVRGIASRQLRGNNRLHLNLDLALNNQARRGERKVQPGVLLGYSHPLGYPTRFDRTMLAQIGYRANEERGQSGIATLGLGLRQQVSVRSVFDLGLKSDLIGGRRRDAFQLVAGYSTQF